MNWSLVLSAILICGSVAGCGHDSRQASILLFDGAGTSPNDVRALERVLDHEHLDYATADSTRLNGMSLAQLRTYRLIIMPGGNFITMGEGLSAAATERLRQAVQQGTNYLGICAGGFLAGDTTHNSFNLTGARFSFYAAEAHGVRKAAVAMAVPQGPSLDQYWEDGPQFSGWGAVAGRYPDGTPAVVEGSAGAGWVVLAGIHAEAPQTWRHGLDFRTPAAEDNAYAGQLVRAALTATPLPHY